MSDTHKIMFLGPSGAGKTTLLSSFYREIPSKLQELGGGSISCVDTHLERDLIDKISEIGKVEDDRYYDFKMGRLTGTQGLIKYPFSLMSTIGESLLNFDVVDHKGGDIRINNTDTRARENLTELLKASDSVLIVVDAAVMMSDPSNQKANEFNQYTAIYDYLHKRIMESDRPLLAQFLLTKCEKWWRGDAQQDPKLGRALIEKANESLSQSFELIREASQRGKQVVGIIEPVLTLNCVEFWRRVPHPTDFELVFKRRPLIPYKPDVSTPLMRSLAFCITQALAKRGWFERILHRRAITELEDQLKVLCKAPQLMSPQEGATGALDLLHFQAQQ